MNLTYRPRRTDLAWVGFGVGMLAAGFALFRLKEKIQRRQNALRYDYSSRSGFPRPLEAMRGAAADFEAPADLLKPKAMRVKALI